MAWYSNRIANFVYGAIVGGLIVYSFSPCHKYNGNGLTEHSQTVNQKNHVSPAKSSSNKNGKNKTLTSPTSRIHSDPTHLNDKLNVHLTTHVNVPNVGVTIGVGGQPCVSVDSRIIVGEDSSRYTITKQSDGSYLIRSYVALLIFCGISFIVISIFYFLINFLFFIFQFYFEIITSIVVFYSISIVLFLSY